MEHKVKQITAFCDAGLDTKKSSENGTERNLDYTYDVPFKKLFADRAFLAPVLKNIIPEYQGLALEDIEKLITANSNEAVSPQVYNSEDVGKGNETVTHYDVLVSCALPDGEMICVGFYFDLEMQRDSEPVYPVVKRGIYYCSRLISRQIDRLGKESYNKIKPVYSVWIMLNNIPESLRDSIYTVELAGYSNKETADITALNKDADLIHLVLVYLSESFEPGNSQSNLINYLHAQPPLLS